MYCLCTLYIYMTTNDFSTQFMSLAWYSCIFRRENSHELARHDHYHSIIACPTLFAIFCSVSGKIILLSVARRVRALIYLNFMQMVWVKVILNYVECAVYIITMSYVGAGLYLLPHAVFELVFILRSLWAPRMPINTYALHVFLHIPKVRTSQMGFAL